MINKLLACIVILFSANAFSDRIVIPGKPVVLVMHPGYFVFPDDYAPRKNLHYVTLMNKNRVCFLKPKPELESLDTIQIIIEESGKKFRWTCYLYSSRYFERDF